MRTVLCEEANRGAAIVGHAHLGAIAPFAVVQRQVGHSARSHLERRAFVAMVINQHELLGLHRARTMCRHRDRRDTLRRDRPARKTADQRDQIQRAFVPQHVLPRLLS